MGGKPLLAHWVALLADAGIALQDIFIVSNDTFYGQFSSFAQEHKIPLANVINDKSTTNDNRLGAVRDMQLAVNNIPGDKKFHLMVVGADTLFFDDFSVKSLIQDLKTLDHSLVLHYPVESTDKYGILELDENSRVIGFLEKPRSDQTKSRTACPCFYLYHQQAICLLDDYINNVNLLASPNALDAPGNFLAWVWQRVPITARGIRGRIDIGNLDSYVIAQSQV